MDNVSSYQDWLVETSVYNIFTALLNKGKKSTKAEVKGQIDELEKLFKEAHQKGLEVAASPLKNGTPPPLGALVTPPPPLGSHLGDDFSCDVLSSARRSLVRGTPLSGVRGTPLSGVRGTPLSGASMTTNTPPIKFELDAASSCDSTED